MFKTINNNVISDEDYIKALKPFDIDYAEKLEKNRKVFIDCVSYNDDLNDLINMMNI